MTQDELFYQYLEEVLNYPRRIIIDFDILTNELGEDIIRVNLGTNGKIRAVATHHYHMYTEWVSSKRSGKINNILNGNN